MINEPTFNASLTNQDVSSATPSNISFDVLWFEQIQTWAGTTKTWRELSDNVVLTNL